MSKEREAFETQRHGYRQGYQDAKAHYQPLLDAKDAEIERLKEAHIYTDNSKAAALLQVENTTLKALLEQAREGLQLASRTLNLYAPHDYPNKEAISQNPAMNRIMEIRKALSAINAATGEK